MIVYYDEKSKKFLKSVMEKDSLRAEEMDDLEMDLRKFDAFFFACSRSA